MPFAICGVHEVPSFTQISLDHIISIRDHTQPMPDIRALKGGFTLHSFVFDDTGDATAKGAVSQQMMERLVVDIYGKHIRPEQTVLFHCFAGVSRSSAAAFIWLVHCGMPYAEAYQAIVNARGPFVCPNQLMVKHADALMGRGGEMEAFVATETGRRAEERAAWFEQHQQ